MKKIKKSTIVLSVIALTALLIMGLIFKARIERQREIELMIEQNQIGSLVRVFNLKNKDGLTGLSLAMSEEYCTIEQYYNLMPTTEGTYGNIPTAETIENLNAFAARNRLEYDGQICKFTIEEVLNDPMGTYEKLATYNDQILRISDIYPDIDIGKIADGFYNEDEE